MVSPPDWLLGAAKSQHRETQSSGGARSRLIAPATLQSIFGDVGEVLQAPFESRDLLRIGALLRGIIASATPRSMQRIGDVAQQGEASLAKSLIEEAKIEVGQIGQTPAAIRQKLFRWHRARITPGRRARPNRRRRWRCRPDPAKSGDSPP